MYVFFFFFNDTATTEIYTLSLHDALPISSRPATRIRAGKPLRDFRLFKVGTKRGSNHRDISSDGDVRQRSEEHTSELQSRQYLVCRLLLEKKKQLSNTTPTHMITHISDQY